MTIRRAKPELRVVHPEDWEVYKDALHKSGHLVKDLAQYLGYTEQKWKLKFRQGFEEYELDQFNEFLAL